MSEVTLGASFSILCAQNMKLDPKVCLEAALKDLGVKRLRLMSYWPVHEPVQGVYDFSELDWQFELASKYKADVSLAIGLRQPRWPESHWTEWAKELPKEEWQTALINYIKAVVDRYKDHPTLHSWQLENEAMLKRFGVNGEHNRDRLRKELKLVRQLDTKHPIIMSLSDSWGLPILGPKPDQYAISIYRYFYDRGVYRHSRRPALFYMLRAFLIRIMKQRRTFIHEMQAEPWGPTSTENLPLHEQYKSMNLERVKEAVQFAQRTQLKPVDFWGLEWWYLLKTKYNESKIWEHMKSVF